MNDVEAYYFDKLTQDRTYVADVLDRTSVRGYKDSVVEKYSDQAHFIYELLQNADDANAKNVRFILEKTRLIFAHDGTRHFSVTDCDNEEIDSKNNVLGDINSITSIANSNKKNENSIGKFGVGFKAVFQYTNTPHIYDPNFKFKIERFIVPKLLNEDFDGRKPNETLFVFPFNHPKRSAEESFDDILDKLKSLKFPLLFLTNLEHIEFCCGELLGNYEKKIDNTIQYGVTTAEHIFLKNCTNSDKNTKQLWLFSRHFESKLRYSVGYFINQKNHLSAINLPAYCFFPTKENTFLNFIIHAPFLLTDSREGIRAGEKFNREMIDYLADLAADALEYLKDIGEKTSIRLLDDNIIKIIPTDDEIFGDPDDKSSISFLPFYTKIKEKILESSLIPTKDGFTNKDNAYWASVSYLTQLFSNEQLSDITENKEAKWAFPTLGREEVQRNRKSLFSYIEDLVFTNINEDAIINGRTRDSYYNPYLSSRISTEKIKGITSDFIEKQDIDWLHNFYKWLSETSHRSDIIKTKPIFLDQNHNAVAAYNRAGEHILFLPIKNISGYTVVNSVLLKNKDTKKFIKQIGVTKPSLQDYITNIIIPTCNSSQSLDTNHYFEVLFEYYCQCPNEEVKEYIDKIKECQFLIYKTGDKIYRGSASEMYLPTPELRMYFEDKKDVNFIDLDRYKELVGEKYYDQLISFLKKLEIRQVPALLVNTYSEYSASRNDLPTPRSTLTIDYEDKYIEGSSEILHTIELYQDEEKSVCLWNMLLEIIKDYEDNNSSWDSFNYIMSGKANYYYYTSKYCLFESTNVLELRNKKWIKNKDGEFVAPSKVFLSSISDIYNTNSEYIGILDNFLEFEYDNGYQYTCDDTDDDEDDNLTDEQKRKIDLANTLELNGINEDNIEELIRIKNEQEAKKALHNRTPQTTKYIDDDYIDSEDNLDNEENNDVRDLSSYMDDHIKKKSTRSKSKLKIVKDIIENYDDSELIDDNSSYEIDEDEFTPSIVDYSKKIERAKQKSAGEIQKIAYFEELQSKAISKPKYTFGWFKTLLEMESINNKETNSRSREVSISFSKVEKEKNTNRTLILKYPNRYIPQFMEDLTDIPLSLIMEDKTKTVFIEVANIKSYTLRVKVKNADDIKNLDLSKVQLATIEARSPSFLLEELKNQFAKLNYSDDFDMQENLTPDLEFIFGPPGTGKTTYLGTDVLIPLMNSNDDCKVLVLTPTNKSADVLVRRIMEILNKDDSYNEWLIRFGATGDEQIEESTIYKDRTFDIESLSKSIVVTTIARFPYDYFISEGNRKFICNVDWDYIVIDEASMIPIANIIYLLYKSSPDKFIIAGDPFQIEPIASVDLWKNENIYTLTHLDSFNNPNTVPYDYEVKLLTTQYRSIPSIGKVFSNFAYDGILHHHRKTADRKNLNISDVIDLKSLNIIKYPVSKYESIYSCKRLQHSSSYQIYSAIFTFEFVSYLAKLISSKNENLEIKIGIIAPYRAQADMIEKLVASENMPNSIEVQVGTIHGFQGDECDIVFTVFNTPPTISSSKEMFLNQKNIINVAISRAKDYLFVIMPDDYTENISNLRLVKKLEKLIHGTGAWKEFSSNELEELMFKDSKYIENNVFSTSHQSVNVYGLPERVYEVRTEENAIDIQIHKDIKRKDYK